MQSYFIMLVIMTCYGSLCPLQIGDENYLNGCNTVRTSHNLVATAWMPMRNESTACARHL